MVQVESVGNMALIDYAIKSQVNRWSNQLGVEQWELVYAIPTSALSAERSNFRVSLANLLPGADATDAYAPCIHASYLTPDPENPDGQLLTVLYQRPTTDMLLQPGRGLLDFGTYSTTKTEETAVWRDGREIMRQQFGLSSTAQFASWTSSIEKREALLIEERALVILRLADWAKYELPVYQRGLAWVGMGGEFTIGKAKFDNLKLARVDMSRKETDASVVLSTWQFARNAAGWQQSGVVAERWAAFDWQGNPVEYDPDADPPVVPPLSAGFVSTIKLRSTDSDVVRGTVDFRAVEQYFTWMKGVQ